MTVLTVHVGVGKTGTTSIQENILARHSQVLSAGRPFHQNPEYEAFHFALTSEEDRALALRTIDEFVAGARAEASGSGRVVVVSDETLTRAPLGSAVAERLAAVAPEARILLTVRNQLTIIPSYYSGHGCRLVGVPRPWNGRAVAFDDWFEFALQDHQSFLKAIDYSLQFRIYAERFGAGSVTVLPYEHLAEQPERFARALAGALGIDAEETTRLVAGERRNPRRSARSVAYRRLRSRLLPNTAISRLLPGGTRLKRLADRLIRRGASYWPKLSPAQAEIVRRRYAPGNRYLAEATGLHLAGLGYPMESSAARSGE